MLLISVKERDEVDDTIYLGSIRRGLLLLGGGITRLRVKATWI